MNTTQLECFLAVAEYLNFSKAADSLKITQPAVSHQITSLEDELGARLFMRTSKHVSLTEAGFMFIEDASGILKIAAGAKGKLGAAMENTLTLHIGCHNQSEVDLLPSVINKLVKSFPSLHPSIKLIPFKSMANLLEEERIHVMFGFHHEQQKGPPGFFHELADLPVACVCCAGHPYADCAVLDAGSLNGPIVVCEPRRLPQPIQQSQAGILARRHPSELFFADSYESMLAMIKAGLGFALLPAYPGRGQGELRYIPVKGIEPIKFGLYYKSLKGNSVLKEFIRLMDESV